MIEKFEDSVLKLYNIILQPLDIIYKKIAIQNCRKIFGMSENESFGQEYYKVKHYTRATGAIYTPPKLAEYIVNNTINEEDVVKNPYLKILDPACGTGNIIIPGIKRLKSIFEKNLDLINSNNNLDIDFNLVVKHILDNNIYGFDIDKIALKILQIDIFEMYGYVNFNKFITTDFLLTKLNCKYDIIVGNPPYIGHKSIDKAYARILKNIYSNVYSDKGDISYCFFSKSIDNLKFDGKLTFITLRYFMESQSGENLRGLIGNYTYIYKIVDFYGIRPFKGIGIDPVIIFLRNRKLENYNAEVIRPIETKYKGTKLFLDSLFLNKLNKVRKFYVGNLYIKNNKWNLVDENERKILDKIFEKTHYTLDDICTSYQGIITGCDRAFVVDKDTVLNESLETNIIKPWIKSSFIKKNEIIKEDKFLIYSDLIDDEKRYPNIINHIYKYKCKLLDRRECKNGIRKWFELQWGRSPDLFEGKKIIFPYKSSNNRFSIDIGSYFSADVYALCIKEEFKISYEYISELLNSRIYEFYFKTIAKKLGEDLFEYYPNKLMKLKIPLIGDCKRIDDDILDKYFNITASERQIIDMKNI